MICTYTSGEVALSQQAEKAENFRASWISHYRAFHQSLCLLSSAPHIRSVRIQRHAESGGQKDNWIKTNANALRYVCDMSRKLNTVDDKLSKVDDKVSTLQKDVSMLQKDVCDAPKQYVSRQDKHFRPLHGKHIVAEGRSQWRRILSTTFSIIAWNMVDITRARCNFKRF